MFDDPSDFSKATAASTGLPAHRRSGATHQHQCPMTAENLDLSVGGPRTTVTDERRSRNGQYAKVLE
jgi:hypothetical protein